MPRFSVNTETTLLLVIIVLGIVFSVFSPAFLTIPNLVDLIEAYAVTTIFAAGVFVVLVSGGIDISFAATAAVSQYVAAYLAANFGWDPLPTIGLACVIGFALGSVNAFLTHYLRVVSIIITIATSSIYFSLLIHVTGGSEIYDLPDWWTTPIVFARFNFGPHEFAKISLPIVTMFVVVIVTHLIMNHTRLGRQVYALGGNADSAKRLGVRILSVQVFAYGYLGLLAGIAGLLQAHRVGQVVPTALQGSELNVLAVAILGGASLAGGTGSMVGVILGVLLLAILQNGLNLIGAPSSFFEVVIGLVILVSITATALAGRQSIRLKMRRAT
jgi:simple sugar transport system permease protein